MARKPIPDRKPVPSNSDIPAPLRVGPQQVDGSSESRPQAGRATTDEMPPALSPGSVPVYQERSPARKSAEVRRSGEADRPLHPPEFAHLAAASAKNLSPPTQQFSNLNVAEQPAQTESRAHITPQTTGSNPWGDALPESGILHAPPNPAPLQHVDTADSANDAWAFEAISKTQPAAPSRAAPAVPGQAAPQPLAPQELPAESPGWDEEEAEHMHTPQYTPSSHRSGSVQNLAVPPALPDKGVTGAKTPEVDQGSASTNPWEEAAASSAAPKPRPISTNDAREEGGWEELTTTSPTGKQESGVVTGPGAHILDQPINPPALPPRSTNAREDEGVPPVMPPRPSLEEQPWVQEQTYAPPPGPPPGHPQNANDQKYQIKKITWHDHSSSFNPRVSPILTQNANGPCPLLALVNAMILSTPSNETNEVAQYLASKTEVSLDDLLQAIINEHLSEENCRKRKEKGQEEYPDIGELHEFLKRLHTGMNVNPRFIPPVEASSPASLRNSMSHVHPSSRSGASIPGGFEQTKELDLYASFGIRLIHGWLPEPSSPAYKAFREHAQTHEDAQLILLRQDDLEAKLSSPDSSLSEQEAELLQDIYLIHDFFRTHPTQLTPFGLEALRTSLRNGEFAILFRNSHFLVTYKHPESEMLFCLVSDEGYRDEGEAVWESLGDVSGAGMEIFSGDFSILSGANHQSRSGSGANPTTSPNSAAGGSAWVEESEEDRKRREREDADMAFALSIQDEFNEESEAQVARRRREQELSEQFIESARRQENTIPIERPEGGSSSNSLRGGGGGTWASRGGAGPIGPAPGALGRGRTSMLDPGLSSSASSSSSRQGLGVTIPTPTRRRPSGGGPFTPHSPISNTGSIRPIPIPIPFANQGPLRVTNHHEPVSPRDSAGIPTSLLQAPQRPVDPEAGVDNPPPSYEMAASQPKYEGPIERPVGGGMAVAGGVIGEAAGVLEAEGQRGGGGGFVGQGQGQGQRGMGGMSLRDSIASQRRRVSELRRAQVEGQAGVGAQGQGQSPIGDPRGQGRGRREDGDCCVM